MRKGTLPIVLVAMLLSSCGGGADSSSDPLEDSSEEVVTFSFDNAAENDDTYPFDFYSLLLNDEDGRPNRFTCSLPYMDEYFLQSAVPFSKKMALASIAMAFTSETKQRVTEFFEKVHYDNLFCSADYGDVPEHKYTVRYAFAHKAVSDFDVIAIDISGFNYLLPWGANAEIGLTGNASGFQFAAEMVLNDLADYCKPYEGKPIKIWLCGYSRGAAIANIVAETMLDEGSIAEDDMFCYTFDASAVVDISIKKPHPSIHNIINSASIINYLYPKSYGFARAGIDIDIYNKQAGLILSAFDERFDLPSFTPSFPSYITEADFCKFVIRNLSAKSSLSEDNPKYVPDMHDRETYVNNGYEASLSYLLELVMGLSRQAKNALIAKVKEEGRGIMEEGQLYAAAKEVLESFSEPFDDAMLADSCNKAVKQLTGNATSLVLAFASAGGQQNCLRTSVMHCPEAFIPLLLCYQPA